MLFSKDMEFVDAVNGLMLTYSLKEDVSRVSGDIPGSAWLRFSCVLTNPGQLLPPDAPAASLTLLDNPPTPPRNSIS